MNLVSRYDIPCLCGETISLLERTLKRIIENLQELDRAAPKITFLCQRCKTALRFDYLNTEPAEEIDEPPRTPEPSVCIVTTKCGEERCGFPTELVSVAKSGTTPEQHLVELHGYDWSKYFCEKRHSLRSAAMKQL